MQAAIYARVSTVRQAENDLSIPDQLRQLHEWAKANGCLIVNEFVEPGASATDDKRPVFQDMIACALQKPAPFQVILIHAFSRFFRDGIEFGVYERKLARNGVKVISITQPTGEDSAGEMMRRIINLFDEHQSKENSKHTSRAMRENARQGFFNGSKAPFGYRAETTDVSGSRGRKKKKLAIDETEADVVRLIYRLYNHGLDGQVFGVKEIAKYLHRTGHLMRGKPWTTQKVHTILADELYMGNYYFNVRDSRTMEVRPPEEWVKTDIPPIVDAAAFEATRLLREARAPQSEQAVPKTLASPVVLAGIIRCGKCGHRMTLATGKSGKYRYYKCTSRRNQGNHACESRNLAMEMIDDMIVEAMVTKVLAQDKLQVLMEKIRREIQEGKDSRQTRVAELERQLKNVEERQHRLLDAIESGVVDLDETTHQRSQQLKTAREALLIQIAEARKAPLPPAVEFLKPSQVDVLGKKLRERLLSKDAAMVKNSVQMLVGEVMIHNDEAIIRGSHAALAAALHQMKMGTSVQVPTFIYDWRARQESNL